MSEAQRIEELARDLDNRDRRIAGLESQAEKQDRRIGELEAEVGRLKREGMCDVCAGTGKVITTEAGCICGGSGRVADGFDAMRQMYFDAVQRAEQAEAALKVFQRDLAVATIGMPTTPETTDEDRLDWLCKTATDAQAALAEARKEIIVWKQHTRRAAIAARSYFYDTMQQPYPADDVELEIECVHRERYWQEAKAAIDSARTSTTAGEPGKPSAAEYGHGSGPLPGSGPVTVFQTGEKTLFVSDAREEKSR